MKLEIEDLIAACIANDRQSQKQLYMLTSDRLMNVSRRYTTDINDAKDVLQNAYVQIFKNLKHFDIHKGELDSWLVKIVINEALQLLRKKKNHHLKDALGNDSFQEISNPEAIARLNAEDILKLVCMLPEGYRLIFNMAVVEGYSHKEISSKLNITESTSRSQLTRAKKMLRELFEKNKRTELC